MRRLAALLFIAMTSAGAQQTPGKLTFALPDHPGSLTLDQGQWTIDRYSAKERGNEFGIRAEDGNSELLGFLFVDPTKPGTAEGCRKNQLSFEGLNQSSAVTNVDEIQSASGQNIAIALVHFTKHNKLRAFLGSDDLCADFSFDFPHTTEAADKVFVDEFISDLRSVNFDPKSKPTFLNAFTYATVDFDLHLKYGAVHNYNFALERVLSTDEKKKWAGIIVNQLGVAVEFSSAPRKQRSALNDAIKHDPNRPGYYILLARLDAREGNVEATRSDLQKYFDNRANLLPGELFHDPAADESIRRLQSNNEFWAFVQTLNKPSK